MNERVPNSEAYAALWKMIKDRSIPVKSVTKAEYDILDEASKNSDVLWLISNGQTTVPGISMDDINAAISDAISKIEVGPTLDEYDSDDWHVRKWSNGYIEMTTTISASFQNSQWVSWGSSYNTPNFPTSTYPVPLVKKYAELYGEVAGSHAITILPVGGSTSSLEQTQMYFGNRGTLPASTSKISIWVHVIGRWK